MAFLAIPLIYMAGEFGWMVAEIGRQPWAIQDLLPLNAAVSNIEPSSVATPFFIFLAVFAFFLVIELRIMAKSIKMGPKIQENTDK